MLDLCALGWDCMFCVRSRGGLCFCPMKLTRAASPSRAALPTMDIAEGGLNNLIQMYKDALPAVRRALTRLTGFDLVEQPLLPAALAAVADTPGPQGCGSPRHAAPLTKRLPLPPPKKNRGTTPAGRVPHRRGGPPPRPAGGAAGAAGRAGNGHAAGARAPAATPASRPFAPCCRLRRLSALATQKVWGDGCDPLPPPIRRSVRRTRSGLRTSGSGAAPATATGTATATARAPASPGAARRASGVGGPCSDGADVFF